MFDQAGYWKKRAQDRLSQADRLLGEAFEFLKTPELQTDKTKKAFDKARAELNNFYMEVSAADIERAVAEAEMRKSLNEKKKGGDK